MKILEQIAHSLLRKQLEKHDRRTCRCDSRHGGYGLCYAGQWLEGVIDGRQVINDLKAK